MRSWPWNNTFSITNYNSSYPFVSTITASDKCTSKSKNIYLINRDHIIELNPNPVLTDINVRINYLEISQSNPINVIITDIQGNIKHQSIQYSNEFSINASSYSMGNYFLNASQNGDKYSKQFIKQ